MEDLTSIPELPVRAHEIIMTVPEEGVYEFTGDAGLIRHKKSALDSVIKANGKITVAYAKYGGAHRNTINRWCDSDAEFARAIEDIQEFVLDLAEMSLEERMMSSDTLLIYFLNNKGRSRGYVPPALASQQVIKNEIVVVPPVQKPRPDQD